MHELRRWITERMAHHDWNNADLSRASGISTQIVSNMLSDERDSLDRLPAQATIAGLARAFGVSRPVVMQVIGRAMGMPTETPTLADFSTRSLLDEISERVSILESAATPNLLHPDGPRARDVSMSSSDGDSSGVGERGSGVAPLRAAREPARGRKTTRERAAEHIADGEGSQVGNDTDDDYGV